MNKEDLYCIWSLEDQGWMAINGYGYARLLEYAAQYTMDIALSMAVNSFRTGTPFVAIPVKSLGTINKGRNETAKDSTKDL